LPSINSIDTRGCFSSNVFSNSNMKPDASDEKMPILTMPSSDRPIAATSSAALDLLESARTRRPKRVQ
jgi:hypothetical protein